jgi:hypothetical protein
MSRRFVVAMLGLGLALILMPQVSLAAEDHIAEAKRTPSKPLTMAIWDMPMSSPLTLRPR